MPNNQNVIQKPKSVKAVDENSMEFVGTIVRAMAVPERDVVVLTLATRGSSNEANYPHITCYGPIAQAAKEFSEYREGDAKPKVRITAQVQTSRKEYDGEPRYFENYVADSISLGKKKIEGIKQLSDAGRVYEDDVNKAIIAGEVMHTYDLHVGEKNEFLGTIVTMRTGSRLRNFPKITCLGKAGEVAKNLKVGEYAAIVGFVRTRAKELPDGTKRYFENLQAQEVIAVNQ